LFYFSIFCFLFSPSFSFTNSIQYRLRFGHFWNYLSENKIFSWLTFYFTDKKEWKPFLTKCVQNVFHNYEFFIKFLFILELKEIIFLAFFIFRNWQPWFNIWTVQPPLFRREEVASHLRSRVNFINILRSNFLYESVLLTFSLVTVCLCNFLVQEYRHKSCS